MKKKLLQLYCVLLVCVGASTGALGAVTAEEPWVRATVPGQGVAAAYMKLRSAESAALVEVRTPAAAQAEIHEMRIQDGVMKMRGISRLALPAGRTVELKPGGYHLMLMKLANPLKPGDKVPLTLIIERQDNQREELQIEAEVRSATGGMKPAHGHQH